MTLIQYVALLLYLFFNTQVTCRPSPSQYDVSQTNPADPKATCSAISGLVESAEDFKAKERAGPGICPNNAYHIFRRQAAGTTDDYSCGPSNPCSNGACCAKSGYCGYGPDSCGDGTTPNDKCWSNCDAHAECGRYAKTPGQTCPLNVCCSQYGFCGMTEEFCTETGNVNTTCQSNCNQPGSGASGGDVQSRIIGYYEAWNWNKSCIGMQLKDIPVSSITHLHYAFAYITPGSFQIVTMDNTVPTDIFSGITALKKKNPDLKVIVSVGGWSFSDNGTATQPLFGEVAGNSGNRATFINNLLNFMQNYGFDGVDFDWEYPGAGDRGGSDQDGPNYTQLLADLRAKFSGVISFTAPTSYWYLRHFDLTKMTKHVDWINVMSYDLHGTWDSSDPIGNHVLAHTNLTEIKLALDLYWRNSIPPNKLNLGLGFYGRSFQLSDPSCYQPGCLFKGGASPGHCTQNSGTLSYREIMDVIDQYNLSPYYDQVDQVKYITWNSDQWVSYDDQDTFQAKIKFANNMGLGGLLIWSLDQDTAQLDALAGVIYPKTLGSLGSQGDSANNWQNMGGGDCRVTNCGTTGCSTGEVHMTDQQCDGKGHQSSLCCPLASAPDPKTCTWRGSAPLCNGQCHRGEVALESNAWGSGSHCTDGLKFYCCPADNEVPACRWTDCGESCSSTENQLTWAEENCWSGRQAFCCDKQQDWHNCQWYGKGGSCFDDHCPTGHSVSLTTSYEGEGVDCGIHFERQRSFCCDPAKGKSPFLPVPLDYLFPNPPTGDDVDTEFTLKVDPTYGGADTGSPFADEPEDAEFGFIVLASPQEIQISLDKRDGSHWDVFDCFDAKSEEEQTVRMMCTDHSNSSNCDDIYLGHGAAGTIIEMPKGCGPGKYAVVKHLTESSNQSLPQHLDKRGVAASTIYDLTFDYDFSRVPRDLGTTQMRIDVSNEPGYWDKVVDKAASKRKVKRDLSEYGGNHRRWLEDAWREDKNYYGHSHKELHKRWFGSDIIAWLQGLLNGDSDSLDVPIIANRYTDDFTVVLLNENFPNCPIGPGGTEVSGKLNVQATTHVDIETSFGFTLITDLQSLDFSNSYLYFRNRGEVSAKFTADAVATAMWQSGDVKLLSADQFGATFSVPGIVTIGPNFVLNGNVKGSLTLAAYFEANVNVASWDIRQTYPVANEDWDPDSKTTPNRDGTQELLAPEFEYGVSASGAIEAHVKPTVSFGIMFNKKITSSSATVNLVADGHVTFHADASTGSSGSSFCYGVDAGADLYATVQAPHFPGWSLPSLMYPLASTPAISIVPYTCPISSRDLTLSGQNETHIYLPADSQESSHLSTRSLEKRGQVYGPVFRIPQVTCPMSNGGPTEPSDCTICTKAAVSKRQENGESCLNVPGNPDEDTCTSSAFSKRDMFSLVGGISSNDTGFEDLTPLSARGATLHQLVRRTNKKLDWDITDGVPGKVDFGPFPSCDQASGVSDSSVSRWWGFESTATPQNTCPVTITKMNKNQVTGLYQTDHILEAQTIVRFLDMLREGTESKLKLPNGYTAASDEWVSGALMGFSFGTDAAAQEVQVEGQQNLLVALSKDLGGSGGGGSRLAIVASGINNAKGTFFEGSSPGTTSTQIGVRASKVFQRDIAGVFQYMQQNTIWNRFKQTSALIEASLHDFDQVYNWGSRPGHEIGRPPRGTNQPAAGLRDLWCFFIDRELQTIETRASAWPGAAQADFQQMFGTQPEGQAWLQTFYQQGSIVYKMQFPHDNPGTAAGQQGVVVANSRFGCWNNPDYGTGLGPAGPW